MTRPDFPNVDLPTAELHAGVVAPLPGDALLPLPGELASSVFVFSVGLFPYVRVVPNSADNVRTIPLPSGTPGAIGLLTGEG